MVLLAALALVATACGGGTTDAPVAVDLTQDSTLDDGGSDTPADDAGDEPVDEPADDPVEEPEPDPTATPEPVVEERSIEDVAVSTVKIEAEGSYVAVGDITAHHQR